MSGGTSVRRVRRGVKPTDFKDVVLVSVDAKLLLEVLHCSLLSPRHHPRLLAVLLTQAIAHHQHDHSFHEGPVHCITVSLSGIDVVEDLGLQGFDPLSGLDVFSHTNSATERRFVDAAFVALAS